jgi:hypothetical protein
MKKSLQATTRGLAQEAGGSLTGPQALTENEGDRQSVAISARRYSVKVVTA